MERLEDSGLIADRVSAAAATSLDPELRYAERRPPPALRDAAACTWRSHVGRGGHVQRLLPDGCVEVVFTLDAPPIVYGPRSTWYELHVPPGEHLGVRLLPGAAARLLRINAADLAGEARQLHELGAWRCPRDVAPDDQMRHLLCTLVERAAHTDIDAGVAEALALLHSRPGIGVTATARRIGVSERHLRRRFVREVGLTPGGYRRIARANATIRAARQGALRSWAQLAYDLGYSDQAHLSREIRALTGSAPTEWEPKRPALSPRR